MESVLSQYRHRLPQSIVRAQIDRHSICIRVEIQMPILEDLPDGDGLPFTPVLRVLGLYENDEAKDDHNLLHHSHFGNLANSQGERFRSRLVGFDSQEAPTGDGKVDDFPQHYWLEGKRFLMNELERMCGSYRTRTSDLIILGDVYGIDLYGRMLVDIRDVFHWSERNALRPLMPKFEMARRCLSSGYSYPTPYTLMTDRLWEAFSEARENKVGAFKEDKGPFYDPYQCRKRRRENGDKVTLAHKRVRYSE